MQIPLNTFLKHYWVAEENKSAGKNTPPCRTSRRVSPCEPSLVDSVSHILLVSSIPFDSYSLSSHSLVGSLSSEQRNRIETSPKLENLYSVSG